MRAVHAVLTLVVVWGCSSENNLKDAVGAGHGTKGSETGPNTTTTATNPPQTPGTDARTDSADTGWVWTTPPTGSGPGTVGTGTTGSGTGTTGTGGTAVDTGLTGPEICELAAALTITLDPYQTAGDGRVVYCHSASGSNWVYIESDVSSCLPHLNHDFDVFPTTGCDS